MERGNREDLARKIRRIGYAFFGIYLLWLLASLIISVIGALNRGTARDPFTGQSLVEQMQDCQQWSHRLKTNFNFIEGSGWLKQCRHLDMEDQAWIQEHLKVE